MVFNRYQAEGGLSVFRAFEKYFWLGKVGSRKNMKKFMKK